MVRVRFSSKDLRDRCADSDAMETAWGASGAAAVRRRLQQFAAAQSIRDFAFMPWSMRADGDGRIHLELEGAMAMIVSYGSESDGTVGAPDSQWVVVEAIRPIPMDAP